MRRKNLLKAMKSLFQAGRPVVGEKLIGREQAIKQIISFLVGGQSVVLMAPRRFGKTSILLEVLNRVKSQGLFTAYIDIFATPTKRILAEQITESVLANRKLDKVFANFRKSISSILKQVEFKQAIEDFEFILDFAETKQDESVLLSESIDFIERFSIKYNQQIVCGFDEFGDIEKLDGLEIVKLFRSKLQLQQNTSFLFSGSHESVMNQIFITSKSPFYRFARIINVKEISPDIFKNYIKNEFSRIDVKINPESLNSIIEFTGGQPYYTQLVCRQLEYLVTTNFAKSSSGISKQISINDVNTAIEEAFWAEINYIEKLWEELSVSREQTQVLISIVRGVDSVYRSLNLNQVNVSRALRNLKLKGVIKREGKNYRLIDPMLKYFICRDILKLDKAECIKSG
ncbi:AAA-like domain-containing protein [candidate division KSB1 bacterium]|nr:AAA-like domain-containing protein [candidate division KSB1 bacterium]